MKTIRRRMLSLALAAVLACGLAPAAFAAGSEALDAANALHELGLFNGVGNDADGNPIYELDRAPNRNEAITMLVVLLGKAEEAVNTDWTIPFTDVEAWARPFVGYAYNHKLTAGTSPTTFGGNETVTAAQYITFVLLSLGYKSGVDFQWDKSWELSDAIGLTDGRYSAGGTFTRGDVAIVSRSALSAKLNGTDTTLADTLGVKPAVSIRGISVRYLLQDGMVFDIDAHNGMFYFPDSLDLYLDEGSGDVYFLPGDWGRPDSNLLVTDLVTRDLSLAVKDTGNPFLHGTGYFSYQSAVTIVDNSEQVYTSLTESHTVQSVTVSMNGRTFQDRNGSYEYKKGETGTLTGVRFYCYEDGYVYYHVNDLLKSLGSSRTVSLSQQDGTWFLTVNGLKIVPGAVSEETEETPEVKTEIILPGCPVESTTVKKFETTNYTEKDRVQLSDIQCEIDGWAVSFTVKMKKTLTSTDSNYVMQAHFALYDENGKQVNQFTIVDFQTALGQTGTSTMRITLDQPGKYTLRVQNCTTVYPTAAPYYSEYTDVK